jgi:hypothetical protein
VSAVSDPDTDLFADTLTCDDEFPLALRVMVNASVNADVASRAQAMLRVVALMEESSAEDSDTHNNDLALNRLEAKVDLSISLLASIVAQNTSLPAPVAVRWSRRGMRLSHADMLTPGTYAVVSAYLLPALPLPLDLPVHVLASEAQGDGARLWLQFPANESLLLTGIERQLFRRHRRLIADSRRGR